jgi:hypothetical protein
MVAGPHEDPPCSSRVHMGACGWLLSDTRREGGISRGAVRMFHAAGYLKLTRGNGVNVPGVLEYCDFGDVKEW